MANSLLRKVRALLQSIRSHFLVIATFTSVVLGVIVGIILRNTTDEWTSRKLMYLNFVGELFLRILKSIILPLIATSLITGISSLNLRLSRKIGIRAIVFYLTTTLCSVVLGIVLVSSIKPGVGKNALGDDVDSSDNDVKKVTTVDTLLDLLRNLFPPNLIQACLEQTSTELIPPKFNTNTTGKFSKHSKMFMLKFFSLSLDIFDYEIKTKFIDGTNILGIVAVSTVFGIAMSILQSEITNFNAVINEFYVIIMKLTSWATHLAPIGIFFLVVTQIVQMKNLRAAANSLGLYFLTVLIGCLLHGFVVLPIIYFLLTRMNPFRFIRGLSQALMTAFGTSSRCV